VPIIEEYILEAQGERTSLRVVTSGIPDSPDWDGFVEGTNKGRLLGLSALRHYLEQHAGEPRSLTRLDLDSAHPPGAVWARLTGGSGLGLSSTPGAHFRLPTSDGAALEGAVLQAVEGYGLLANVETLDDALLALGVQGRPDGGTHIRVAPSTFGRRPADRADLERYLSLPLQQVLAATH
jgi:hypothetical protein